MGRASNGRFTKGTSGNPSGRPKRSETEKAVLSAIYSLSDDAVNVVSDIMKDEKVSPVIRLKAAEMVIDRICGKPMSANDIDKYEDNLRINDVFGF